MKLFTFYKVEGEYYFLIKKFPKGLVGITYSPGEWFAEYLEPDPKLWTDNYIVQSKVVPDKKALIKYIYEVNWSDEVSEE